MFETNSLIHFVFANENDIYYCANSLKMDPEQRLWWELHQAGYRTVYFLNRNGQDFAIGSYGDPGIELPSVLFGGTTDTPGEKAFRTALRKWLETESAVVCSLEDFCRVMDNGSRYAETRRILTELQKKHAGILVLTVTPESEGYLESSAFLKEYRQRTKELQFPEAPEGGTFREKAERSRTGSCIFRDGFRKSDLEAFLQHVILNDPEKIPDLDMIPELASYLVMALDGDAILEDRIFAGRTIGGYADLYPVVADPENWKRMNRNCRSTSLQRFYESYQLPATLLEKQVTAEGASRILEDIRYTLESIERGSGNSHIRAHICYFLLLLQKEEKSRDWASCERVLYAIRFCLQWFQVSLGSEEERAITDIIRQLKEYITLSEDYFREEKNLDMIQIRDEHGVAAKTRQQLVTKHAVSRKFLNRYEDLLLSSMLSLSIQQSAADIREVASSIEELTEELETSRKTAGAAEEREAEAAAAAEKIPSAAEEAPGAASEAFAAAEEVPGAASEAFAAAEEVPTAAEEKPAENRNDTEDGEYEYAITPEMYKIML